MRLNGVFVAPVTPLKGNGSIDFDEFSRLVEFLISQGVDGICVGGATSEYTHFDLAERQALITQASQVTSGRVKLLAAVGFSRLDRSLALADHAAISGADALLLPPPHFYRYEQADVEHFYREACRSLPLPTLIYNLPSCTNPVQVETAIRLLNSEARLIGIKDSSGNRSSLKDLATGTNPERTSLIVGDDSLLLEALQMGWAGVISGLGNLCPRLLCSVYKHHRDGNFAEATRLQRRLQEFCDRSAGLPTPWAIRAGLESGGFSVGPLAMPASPARARQLKEFRNWLSSLLDTDLPGQPTETS